MALIQLELPESIQKFTDVGILVICAIGIPANVALVCFVLTSKLKKNISSFYLVCLGAADFTFLLTTLLRQVNLRHISFLFSNWSCKTLMVSHFWAKYWSSLLVVSVCFDRLFIIKYPLKKYITIEKKIPYFLCAATLIGGLILGYRGFYFDSGHLTVRNFTQTVCRINLKLHGRHVKTNHLVTFLLDEALTSILAALTSGICIALLIKARKTRRELTTARTVKPTTESREKRTTLTMLLIAILFVCLRLPDVVVWLMIYFSRSGKRPNQAPFGLLLAKEITFLFVLVNHAINFFLYAANIISCKSRFNTTFHSSRKKIYVAKYSNSKTSEVIIGLQSHNGEECHGGLERKQNEASQDMPCRY